MNDPFAATRLNAAPVFQPRICGFVVDFAWWAPRVIAECDGWATHGRDTRGFARDRERDPILLEDGWVVVRFTWEQITRRPSWVAGRLQGILASRAAA